MHASNHRCKQCPPVIVFVPIIGVAVWFGTRRKGFYGNWLPDSVCTFLSLAHVSYYEDLATSANVGSSFLYITTSGKPWNTDIDGTGNSLNNMIVGTDGNNVLDGMAGADSLVGGDDDDTYIVDDLVFANEDEGTDSVTSSVSFAIVGGVENLTLTGSSNLTATGNTLGNSGANTLAGGAGADTMVGGAGNDTFVVEPRRPRYGELFRRYRYRSNWHYLFTSGDFTCTTAFHLHQLE